MAETYSLFFGVEVVNDVETDCSSGLLSLVLFVDCVSEKPRSFDDDLRCGGVECSSIQNNNKYCIIEPRENETVNEIYTTYSSESIFESRIE